MIKIIPPTQFKKIPWKNGKGVTTELAINDGGNLSDFDWRISIANVEENGDFSDFTGYLRNLVLIYGNGIILKHDNDQSDHLSKTLSFASFEGKSKTHGTLINGSITDFNLITRANLYKVELLTSLKNSTLTLPAANLHFAYSLSGDSYLFQKNPSLKTRLPEKHLAQINSNQNSLSLKGQQLIFIALHEINAK